MRRQSGPLKGQTSSAVSLLSVARLECWQYNVVEVSATWSCSKTPRAPFTFDAQFRVPWTVPSPRSFPRSWSIPAALRTSALAAPLIRNRGENALDSEWLKLDGLPRGESD